MHKLFKSIVKTGTGAMENKRHNNGSCDDDEEDDTVTLDPLTTIMRLATLHLRPKGTKLSFTKHSMLFDLPTTPIHWQGIWRTISSFSGIHSCRNDLSVLKNTILSFRTSAQDMVIGNSSSNSNTSTSSINSSNDTIAVRHSKFTSAAIKGLTKLKQCYDESPDDPIVHCIEFYIALLKEPPRSPMLTSLTSSSSSTLSTLSLLSTSSDEPAENSETVETVETGGDDEKKEVDAIEEKSTNSVNSNSSKGSGGSGQLWSESKEVLIYRLLIEAESQDEQKNYTTVRTLINSIDLLLADADRELERLLKK